MATNSQGVTITLSGDGVGGDLDFDEVLSFSVSGVQADTVEITPRSSTVYEKRHRRADIDSGTVSITALSKNVAGATIGALAQFSILRGAETLMACDTAIVQSFAVSGSVGELIQYSIRLKLSGSVTF